MEYEAGGGMRIIFFVVRDGVVTNPRILLQSIRGARRGVYYYEVSWYPFTQGD